MTVHQPRLTVALSFDFDAMSPWIGTMHSQNPTTISRGEFGAYAIPRILKLLENYKIPATFFVPGHTALAYPGLIKRIADAGHEIGAHGWVHESPSAFDRDTERAMMAQTIKALKHVAGVQPRGYQSSGPDFSPHTLGILMEQGFLYDATFQGADFYPYYLRQGDSWSDSGPYRFGTPVDLVGVPFSFLLDDMIQFEFIPPATTRQAVPSEVLEVWRGEFDYAYRECSGGVYHLCMHPQCIGRGSRQLMLETLLEHMTALDDVIFERLGDYAERWRTENPLQGAIDRDPLHAGVGAIVGDEWDLQSRVTT